MNNPAPTPDTVTDTEHGSMPVVALVHFFETLSANSLQDMAHLYDNHARFKDPFNDVVGLAAIRRIFEHMFATLDQPRFVVTGQVVQGNQCFLTWEFHFAFRSFRKGRSQVVLGGSHLVFTPQGKVILHRDYWDAAEELYEKLPLVGSLMRWLKRRMTTRTDATGMEV